METKAGFRLPGRYRLGWEDSPLDPVAKTAMVANLLTEHDPPSPRGNRYAPRPRWRGGRGSEWTREEGRHGPPASGTAIPAAPPGAGWPAVAEPIATHENLHILFHRNLMGAAMDICPNEAMQAIHGRGHRFGTPSAGTADFARSFVVNAKAGI
jgi:acyl-[acyl-carrier-protein] desaturase